MYSTYAHCLLGLLKQMGCKCGDTFPTKGHDTCSAVQRYGGGGIVMKTHAIGIDD